MTTTNWTFSTWFRVAGVPLLGVLLYLIFCFIDPNSVFTRQYTGREYYLLLDLVEFTAGAILLSESSLWLDRVLNRWLSWERQPLLRLGVQTLALTLLSIAVLEVLIWFITELELPGYEYTPTERISIRQTIALGSLMALFINAVYTGEYFLIRWRTALLDAERLRRESAEARYEALKSQLDPHFLFNNLNTLLYLVTDNLPASTFVENLSLVYRYILQSRDKPLVSLADELTLADAYLALLRERFGEALQVCIDIPPDQRTRQLPPLTLQLLIENAIKHNIVDAKHPLTIGIRLNKNGALLVENSLNRKAVDSAVKTGIGLQNIRHRYQLTAGVEPTVSETNGQFVVQLPLLLPTL